MKKFEDNGQWFRYCPHCNVIYPHPEIMFGKDSRDPDELSNQCNDCNNERSKSYRKNHPNIKKEWYRKNAEREREKRRQYYKLNIEEQKNYSKDYRKTDIGKETTKRYLAKRQRNLKFIPLFTNPFPSEIDVDYHHINDMIVIPIPRITHKKNLGKYHRKKCNNILLKIYGLDVENLLSGRL